MASTISLSMAAKSSLGFHGLSTRTTTFPTITFFQLGSNLHLPLTSNSRFQYAIRMRVKQRLPVVFASKTDPSGSDSVKEKSDGIEAKDSAQGPPFLTILAGFVVLLVLFWILGSVIMWLVGLAVNLSLSK